jgi:hypothetical protein
MSLQIRNGEVMIHYDNKRYTEDAFKVFYPKEYADRFGQ